MSCPHCPHCNQAQYAAERAQYYQQQAQMQYQAQRGNDANTQRSQVIAQMQQCHCGRCTKKDD